ncbi:MAG: hypothetical protein Q4C77_15125 [Eubacteriales bacterium]|nr:hypothetical protein [Eubacteriales bacterium]
MKRLKTVSFIIIYAAIATSMFAYGVSAEETLTEDAFTEEMYQWNGEDVIYDENGIKLAVYEIFGDEDSFSVSISVENNIGAEIGVLEKETSIHGTVVESNAYETPEDIQKKWEEERQDAEERHSGEGEETIISAIKSSMGVPELDKLTGKDYIWEYIHLDLIETLYPEVGTIDSVDFSFIIYRTDSFEVIDITDPLHISLTAESDEITAAGTELYNSNGVRVLWADDAEVKFSEDQYFIPLYIENSTEKTILLDLTNVNGDKNTSYGVEFVEAGKTVQTTLRLDKYHSTSPTGEDMSETQTFSFVVRDGEAYNIIGEGSEIILADLLE